MRNAPQLREGRLGHGEGEESHTGNIRAGLPPQLSLLLQEASRAQEQAGEMEALRREAEKLCQALREIAQVPPSRHTHPPQVLGNGSHLVSAGGRQMRCFPAFRRGGVSSGPPFR